MLNYPVLRAEIAKRGVKKTAMAKALGISIGSFHNKMNGVSDFTWPEVCKVNDIFFPDMDKETLFAEGETNAKS